MSNVGQNVTPEMTPKSAEATAVSATRGASAVTSPAGKKITPPAGRSLWSDARRRLLSNKAAMASIITLLLVIAAVFLGPLLSEYNHLDSDYTAFSAAPSIENGHYFGTDERGRDLFVRTLRGGRVSLLIGVLATLVSLFIGVSYGAISGYLGGRTDTIMMRVVDVLYGLPFIFLVILLIATFGSNIYLVFFAIGAVSWLDMARIVRGQTLSLKNKEFVEAARAIGVPNRHIIFRHVVPNLLGVVIIYATLTVPSVILMESFLGFLGLAIWDPEPSWGVMVAESTSHLEAGAWWMLVFPAAMLSITLFCFNFIGDGLRDALDPKER